MVSVAAWRKPWIMTRHRTAIALTLFVTLGAVTVGIPATAAQTGPAVRTSAPTTAPVTAHVTEPDSTVVDALDRASHRLRTVDTGGDTRDLRPLDRMIGDARVVGLGEATHGSHEFFALKHRVFRHLVEEQGFRTFALEAPWSTGLRLNAYVLRGEGDPRRIMREEFQRGLPVVEQRRVSGARGMDAGVQPPSPRRPGPVHGRRLRVGRPRAVRRGHRLRGPRPPRPPRPLHRALYRGLRPTTAAGAYIEQYLHLPYAERKERADRTGQALKLLKQQARGCRPGSV
ncbi:hypothetical protein GCM10011428_71460 [Streptomyces violaceus]